MNVSLSSTSDQWRSEPFGRPGRREYSAWLLATFLGNLFPVVIGNIFFFFKFCSWLLTTCFRNNFVTVVIVSSLKFCLVLQILAPPKPKLPMPLQVTLKFNLISNNFFNPKNFMGSQKYANVKPWYPGLGVTS